MRKLISVETAGNVLLMLFGLLVVFHILILFNLIPSNIVWGGRAGSSSSPRALLTVSLIFNILFALVVAAKIGYIDVSSPGRVIDIFLWIIFAYLLLNTAGKPPIQFFFGKASVHTAHGCGRISGAQTGNGKITSRAAQHKDAG